MFFFAGCLQEGPEPEGRLLFHGQHLESPSFIRLGDQEMIRFQDILSYPTQTMGTVSDLWISSLDGSVQRKVVTGWAADVGVQGDSGGRQYFTVDQRQVPSGAGQVKVGTLVRLSPMLEEEYRLDQIAAFQVRSISIRGLFDSPADGQTCPGFPDLKDNCPQLFYERPIPVGETHPTLMLWDGRNHLPLGLDASGGSQLQTVGNNAYFLLAEGDHQQLIRFLRPSYALELVRPDVARFAISGDERYAALSIIGKSKVVLRYLKTGQEIEPMRPNAGIGSFSGNIYTYTLGATLSAPAELHYLNMDTGEETVRTLPSPLTDLSKILPRPHDDQTPGERLLLDSAGHGVFANDEDLVGKRVLQGPLYTPSFTNDGKYLVYVSPAAPTLYDTSPQGPLMFQDADHTDQPPIMVSPPGLLASGQSGRDSYFFTEGGTLLVFWAHLGRASSDLYFADYLDGALPTNLRLIAKSIFSVSVSKHALFGILNMSQQDGVGDLVSRNIDTGTDFPYAQSVLDVVACDVPANCGDSFAYIVRGRADSDRSGLWIDSFSSRKPDGGRD